MDMLGTFFKLVGKAIRFSIHRPIQRFNIFSRSKKYLGEDAKYFMPAPRTIGPQTIEGAKPSQYPHLEGQSFKSIAQRRLEALQKRNERLLAAPPELSTSKSFSEIKRDDDLVIETSSKLPVVKTVTSTLPRRQEGSDDDRVASISPPSQEEGEGRGDGALVAKKSSRPLPKLTSLQLQNPADIWVIDQSKVPPGRLSLDQLQEMMINKLGDDEYWTAKQIAEKYNIKEEYAENLITYLKQIRIIISPRLATILDYTAREDKAYQATKHIIYHVDKSLRSELDRKYDGTFLPEDQIDPKIRELLEAGALQTRKRPDERLINLMYRPKPLRIGTLKGPGENSSLEEDSMRNISNDADGHASRRKLIADNSESKPKVADKSDTKDGASESRLDIKTKRVDPTT